MKKIKSRPKLLLLIISIVILVLLLVTDAPRALLGEGVKKEKPTIIYIHKTIASDIEFWRTLSYGIATGAEEFGYNYMILGAREESDIEGNILAVQRAIAIRPDAIVLAAADYDRLQPVAREVVAAGILLLTIDSDVAGDVSRCLIATDNYAAGRQMGEELLSRMPGKGPVAVIGHVKNNYTAEERISGLREVLESNGVGMLEPEYCDNYINRARDKTFAILDRYPDIKGFAATNERVAAGVAEALRERGMNDQIVFVTCDHAEGQIAYIEQGIIDATILQKPFNMGYFSVQMVDELRKNPNTAKVPAFYDTGSGVITKDNYFTPENQKLLFPFAS